MKFSGNNLRLRRHQSGIALVIVMIVIISLSLLAGGFVMSMKIETRLARNAQFDPEMDWLGRSGVELARYVLAQSYNNPNEPYDSLNQFWAGGVGGSNSIPPEITFDNMQLGSGTISIRIEDLERRFNINVADEQILQQAMTVVGVDASEFGAITGSILDWIDMDDDTHIGGTESSFYQRLNPPYSAKNGPLDDPSELLLINGITPEMYWGSGAASDGWRGGPTIFRPGFGNDAPTYPVGLQSLFATLSGPRLNINTAPAEVLMLIPGMDQNLATGVVTARAGPDGFAGNEDDMPVRSIAEIASRVPGMDLTIAQQLARYCDVRSVTFEVMVTARIGELQRDYVAIVRRNNIQDLPILQFYWK